MRLAGVGTSEGSGSGARGERDEGRVKIYSAYRLNDFIICSGYKGQIIKESFARYRSSSGLGIAFA